jgi:hypothetical protein
VGVPGESGVRVGKDVEAPVAKRDVFELERFGAPGAFGFDDLARADGKEEPANDYVDGVVIVIAADLVFRGKVGKGTEEAWGECFLAFGRVIEVFEGPEEGSDGGA